MNLDGKKVLVTGGALRIGRALVLAFARKGAKIAIHHLSSGEQAEQLLEEIGGKKQGHTTTRLDLSGTIPPDFFSSIPRTDILVNNASVYRPETPCDDSDPAHLEQMRVNFLSPLRLARLFAAQLAGKGVVLNILDCRFAEPGISDGSYAFSKASLAKATGGLAIELAPRIRVNGIAPGAVLPPAGKEDSYMDAAEKAAPLKTLPSLRDVTSSAVFLAENESLTGQIIYADCGRHLLNQKNVQRPFAGFNSCACTRSCRNPD